MDSFWGWTGTNSGNFFACVYENREDGSGSDGGDGGGGGGGKLAASNGQTFTRIFLSNFLGWAFLFWSWEGGRVAVCDGSLRVPRCGGCATLRVCRTLFSHVSSLFSSLQVRVAKRVCLCRCAPTPTTATTDRLWSCFLPQFLTNVLLAIPG